MARIEKEACARCTGTQLLGTQVHGGGQLCAPERAERLLWTVRPPVCLVQAWTVGDVVVLSHKRLLRIVHSIT